MDCKPPTLFIFNNSLYIYIYQTITLFHSWLHTYHMYFFQAGGNGCFNSLCSGFVQVSSKFPLGYVLGNSICGGDQIAVSCIIFKVYIVLFNIFYFFFFFFFFFWHLHTEVVFCGDRIKNQEIIGLHLPTWKQQLGIGQIPSSLVHRAQIVRYHGVWRSLQWQQWS